MQLLKIKDWFGNGDREGKRLEVLGGGEVLAKRGR